MSKRGFRGTALVWVAALVLAACSSPPTSDEQNQSDLTDVTEALNGVSQQLEGLDPKARREKLIELADEEGGTFDAYGSTNLDDIFPMIDEFESQTGLEVNYYRASSTDVLERVLQEADADFAGADVVFTNGPELTVIDQEGLLAPLNSPVTDDIDPQGVFDNWAWLYLNTFVGSWNTDRTQDPPATWEDLLAYGDGLAVEVGDFDWFATLVKDYFIAEQGMSEEEAVDLFREAVNGAALVDGHTLMAELLAAGEYDVASSTYLHRILQLKRDQAPVEWEGGPEPIVIRPNGIGTPTSRLRRCCSSSSCSPTHSNCSWTSTASRPAPGCRAVGSRRVRRRWSSTSRRSSKSATSGKVSGTRSSKAPRGRPTKTEERSARGHHLSPGRPLHSPT